MRRLALAAALVAAALLPGAALGAGNVLPAHDHRADFDSRTGSVAPSAAQKARVADLGAKARWNRFGTPQSLIRYGGYLATGLKGAPAEAARSFVRANAALFRLSPAGVDKLELLNDVQLPGSTGHVVTFRQRFGDLAAAQDGLITVALNQGRVTYVSSSAVGEHAAPGAATLSAAEAWARAAADAGVTKSIVDVRGTSKRDEWSVLSVAGLRQEQQARLVAFPTLKGVRAAWEANVVDVHGGKAEAYTTIVDAQSGAILFRRNAVDHLEGPPSLPTAPVPPVQVPPVQVPPVQAPGTSAPATSVGSTTAGATAGQGVTGTTGTTVGTTTGTTAGTTAAGASSPGAFSGSYTATACGSYHDFDVADGTRGLEITALAPGNDIVLELHRPQGTKLASSDIPFGPNPELIQYEPAGGVPAGVYSVRVCPFDEHQLPPMTYTGTFTAVPVTASSVTDPNPRWKVFPANPPLDYATTDTRQFWCWFAASSCALVLDDELWKGPWDYNNRTNTPTFTTHGNNAVSASSWVSPLTPAEQYKPVSPARDYTFPWTNQWYASKCSPEVFASAQRNDIDAAIVNLFAMHNRMHNWSYRLGFTERTYNLQDVNFGKTGPGAYPVGREADPELGDAQAGALDGGAPSYLGRDNANQITLQDGIAPITNMYLWQPIAAAFYAPCVDGDYDMSVIGHEYTHAISNRMVGGPDTNLTGNQSRAMGESWSDLTAVEYLNEYGFVPTNGEDPFAVGPYVTGNKETGIRNYNMRRSPLNYSDVGYDFVCNTNTATGLCTSQSQVHADGEIWSATNYDLRQALVAKYGAGTPELQRQCADGKRRVEECPGNRRWIQIVFDAYLLQQGSTSMLDARDAYLAADMNRFGGANQTELWHVFASRGLGEHAKTASADDDDPVPSFASPREDEAEVTFQVVGADNPATAPAAKIYVGDYEARVTPVADTDPATALDAAEGFVPGTYDFVVQSPRYGLSRFTVDLAAGARTVTFTLHPNWASKSRGATITGDGVNLTSLIDDTESTNWAALGRTPSVAGTQVTVDLSGGERVVDAVKVSAMLRIRDTSNASDSASQNRFTALRQFEIWTCNANDPETVNCTTPQSFTRIYVSPEDAFPAGTPRPLAPTLIFRTFDVPNTAATHVKLVVVTNQCMGQPAYRGEQDNDPANATDCVEASTRDNEVRASELQVYTTAAGDPRP